jgi:hypothetical protein
MCPVIGGDFQFAHDREFRHPLKKARWVVYRSGSRGINKARESVPAASFAGTGSVRGAGARSKHNEKRRMREYLGRIESDANNSPLAKAED